MNAATKENTVLMIRCGGCGASVENIQKDFCLTHLRGNELFCHDCCPACRIKNGVGWKRVVVEAAPLALIIWQKPPRLPFCACGDAVTPESETATWASGFRDYPRCGICVRIARGTMGRQAKFGRKV